MPTPGSNAGSRSDWPMPRMYALIDGPKAPASWLSCTLGASRAISVTLVWPRAASASALTAVIASGVDCTLCCWYSAVTVTSSRPPLLALLAAGAAGACACAKAAEAASVEATNNAAVRGAINFKSPLDMRYSPQRLVSCRTRAEAASALPILLGVGAGRSRVPKIQQSRGQSYAACETRSTPLRHNLARLTLFTPMLHRSTVNVPCRSISVTTKQQERSGEL